MAFVIDLRRVGAAMLALISSAVLMYFGNGLHPAWALVWFAPLPVLLFAPRASWPGAAWVAASASLLGSLSMSRYFTVSLHARPTVWLETYAMVALIFALAVLLFRALLLRGAVWSALLALPSLSVSCEYIASLTTPHGTASSLAYTQLHFLPFLQLASVTGPWGMSFLLRLFPSALAIVFFLHASAPRQAWRIALASFGALALVLLFGAVRLALPLSGPSVRVGLIASDEPANVDVTAAGAETERLLRQYAAKAEELAAAGARVIVLPEKLGVLADTNAAGTDSILQATANRTQATIVVGVVHAAAAAKYNEARVYRPGDSILRYDKQHLLPPFESKLTPGSTLVLLSRPAATWGVAICKDMDFTQPARRYGEAGAGLMLVPGWDFVVDRVWHGHIAVMRGVEDGFSIVRAAKDGSLTISDARGRMLAETLSSAAPFASLVADVPEAHHATLYLLLGDWFAWVTLAVLSSIVVQVFLHRTILHLRTKGPG